MNGSNLLTTRVKDRKGKRGKDEMMAQEEERSDT